MITTFGEIMLRISPKETAERILQATNFEIRPGGSESNVAIALANLGVKSTLVTSLPDNPLGHKVIRQLRNESVNTEFIKMTGGRIGMYWTENGTGPRNSFVIYDRENSAFTHVTFNDFNWAEILRQSCWLHFSGISPAVCKGVTQLLEKVIENLKCPYSVDLNFRNNLWNWAKKDPLKIKEVMTGLCQNATLIAGNESDFQSIFGFNSSSDNELEVYTTIVRQCFIYFPNLQYIAVSNRVAHSATHNDWNGYFFVRNDDQFCYKGCTYNLDNIQDRVGTGDSFVAGIIYGLNREIKMPFQEIIDFAVTLSALNHTTKGDASNFTEEDVKITIKSNGSGRIVR
jgi:2-dehydro-3-deoxygluconokinase